MLRASLISLIPLHQLIESLKFCFSFEGPFSALEELYFVLTLLHL
jgi:hypothetical protein